MQSINLESLLHTISGNDDSAKAMKSYLCRELQVEISVDTTYIRRAREKERAKIHLTVSLENILAPLRNTSALTVSTYDFSVFFSEILVCEKVLNKSPSVTVHLKLSRSDKDDT